MFPLKSEGIDMVMHVVMVQTVFVKVKFNSLVKKTSTIRTFVYREKGFLVSNE